MLPISCLGALVPDPDPDPVPDIDIDIDPVADGVWVITEADGLLLLLLLELLLPVAALG